MTADPEPRRIGRSILDVVLAAPLFVTAPLFRRWHLRWGATDEEVRGPMPGDDFVPQTSFYATRAITIDAPPSEVWPWLVQIGYDRAGFYSYDLFDHGARPSSRRIVPEGAPRRAGPIWARPAGLPASVRAVATCYLCSRPATVEALDTWDRYGFEEVVVVPLCERHAEALKDVLLVFA